VVRRCKRDLKREEERKKQYTRHRDETMPRRTSFKTPSIKNITPSYTSRLNLEKSSFDEQGKGMGGEKDRRIDRQTE
jgi:hypothetical protein